MTDSTQIRVTIERIFRQVERHGDSGATVRDIHQNMRDVSIATIDALVNGLVTVGALERTARRHTGGGRPTTQYQVASQAKKLVVLSRVPLYDEFIGIQGFTSRGPSSTQGARTNNGHDPRPSFPRLRAGRSSSGGDHKLVVVSGHRPNTTSFIRTAAPHLVRELRNLAGRDGTARPSFGGRP